MINDSKHKEIVEKWKKNKNKLNKNDNVDNTIKTINR